MINYDRGTFWNFPGDDLLLFVEESVFWVSRAQGSQQVVLWREMVRVVAELLAHLDQFKVDLGAGDVLGDYQRGVIGFKGENLPHGYLEQVLIRYCSTFQRGEIQILPFQ